MRNKIILSILITGTALTPAIHTGWFSDFCDSDLNFAQKLLKKGKKLIKEEYKIWKRYLPAQTRGILIGAAATFGAGLIIKYVAAKPYNFARTLYYKIRIKMLIRKIANKLRTNKTTKEKTKLTKKIEAYANLASKKDISNKELIIIIRFLNEELSKVLEKTKKKTK